MIERSVERRFKREVERAGGKVRKLVTPGRRHAPDRLVIWPRRIGSAVIDFVELKRPGEKPRSGQLREHHRLTGWGCSVWVINNDTQIDNYIDVRSTFLRT